jgi:hypothetical protein
VGLDANLLLCLNNGFADLVYFGNNFNYRNLHIFPSISWRCLLFSSILLLHSRQKAPKILRHAPVMSAQHDFHTDDDKKNSFMMI